MHYGSPVNFAIGLIYVIVTCKTRKKFFSNLETGECLHGNALISSKGQDLAPE